MDEVSLENNVFRDLEELMGPTVKEVEYIEMDN